MNHLRRTAVLALSICLTLRAVVGLADSGNQWRKLEGCIVRSKNIVELSPQQSGVLQTLNFEENDEITSGVLLAKLDTELVEMELEIADLQAKEARNLAADDSEVEYQKIAMLQAKQEYENHKRVAGSVSGKELGRLKLVYEKSLVALSRAKQSKMRAVVEADRKQAQVRAAKIRLEQCEVASRLNGRVTSIVKRPGQWVEAGQPIVEITDLENLQIDFFVQDDAVDLAALTGAQARVEIAAQDSKPFYLTGEVTSYDPEVSGQGRVRAHVSVKNVQRNGHWVLLPGRPVTLYVDTTEPLLQANVSGGRNSAVSR